MAALLDLHPDTADAVSLGVAELHAVIDRLHATPVGSSRPSADVAEVDRAIRRLESFKLKLVAAADQAGVAKDAGFTGADAWLAKTTTVSRADAARQVALATELESGHDATAEALDAGLVSPEHAAVIVRRHRPATRHGESRSSARSSRRRWCRRRPGSAPTSSAASPAERSRPSNPTRASWTPTRTSWSAPRSKPPGRSAR